MTLIEQRDLVRELARRCREIADSPENVAKIRRWRDTTSGRRADRPPVWVNFNACRREVQPLSELKCEDPYLRQAEDRLRWTLFNQTLGDDQVVMPAWDVPAAVSFEGEHLYGMPIERTMPRTPGGAWGYLPCIREERDLDRLRLPAWRHDAAETDRRRDRATELLGDLLDVTVTCGCHANAMLDKTAADLMGIDALMLNLMLNPEMIHRLMAYLRDFALSTARQIEAMGILTENNSGSYKYFSDSLRQTPPGQPTRLRDIWFWTNSQIFEPVGPAQWREFLLDYQRPITDLFGAVNYGCCENLTLKIDDVMAIPNLGVFTCSPWTDLEKAAERCAARGVCMEWRQLATDIMLTPDLDRIEQRLRRGLEITRGINRIVVLQEIQSVENDLPRFQEWARRAIRRSGELVA